MQKCLEACLLASFPAVFIAETWVHFVLCEVGSFHRVAASRLEIGMIIRFPKEIVGRFNRKVTGWVPEVGSL